jgi:hypothetical protein
MSRWRAPKAKGRETIPAFEQKTQSVILERFRAKWIPVRVKKTRQNKN